MELLVKGIGTSGGDVFKFAGGWIYNNFSFFLLKILQIINSNKK